MVFDEAGRTFLLMLSSLLQNLCMRNKRVAHSSPHTRYALKHHQQVGLLAAAGLEGASRRAACGWLVTVLQVYVTGLWYCLE